MDEEEELKNSSKMESQEKLKEKSQTEEEIEIEEVENEEEEDIKSSSKEEKSNTNNSLPKIISKEKYLLELKENGLPDIPNNKILSCNIDSIINISLYNGLSISSNISLISDCSQLFPSFDFLDKLIDDSIEQDNKNLDNNYFEQKVNAYQKQPSLINTKIYFQIKCERAGNITFIFMYKDENDNNKTKFTKPFYILVNPLIELSKENKIEINQIRMQSVIPKNIGKIDIDFDSYFSEVKLLGYNFIHFKSLQSLSSSDNLYSIKDHNELNDILFETKTVAYTKEEKNEIFEKNIIKLIQKYNIGTITDIILTQTSTESEWILTNTDCAYNLENTPWLNAAYKLDEILINYSNMFYDKKVLSSCAPFINNLNDLEETMKEIENEVYKNNLEEYFLIPLEEYMDKFNEYYKNYELIRDNKDIIIKQKILIEEIRKEYKNKNVHIQNSTDDELLLNESIIFNILSQNCKNYGYKRYGVEISVELISLLIIERYRIKSKKNELIDSYEFSKEIKGYISKINKYWFDKSKEMIKIALLNTQEYLRYQYIQLNRRGIKRKLIDSYFHVIDKNDPKKILLCNGWIMNSEDESNPFPDITAYGNWYYFKRKVIIWKDAIKINYGENIEKTPEFLLDYMSKYITFLANIFDGFYIESITNLPDFILKYLIYKARQINSSIIFITQLPNIDTEEPNIDENINENDKEEEKQNNNKINDIKIYEKKYSEELGINLFVKEIIWDSSNIELIKTILSNCNSINSNITYDNIFSKFNPNLYSMSKTNDNQIYFGSYKYLNYHKPFSILYDLTPDNPSFYEKYNILSIQKSISSSICLLDCAIGSTRGFDQLYPYQISSQNEQRLYFFENNKIKNLIKKVINMERDDPNLRYQEVVFELDINNILLNMNKNIKNDINNIKSVKLALSFHKWIPDITLDKINDSLYMKKVKLPVGKHYYKFVINDNLWVCDSSKQVEIDENKNMNNLLDLNNINTLKIHNLTLLRCYLNCIKEKFYNKKSETFLMKSNDLFYSIRMIIDSKTLINNNIDDEEINKFQPNINNTSSYQISNNNLPNNNINYNLTNTNSDSINLSYANLIPDDLNLYEGYAVITSPTYNIIDDNTGKGEVIIPGKIDSIICSFSSNKEEEEDYDMNNILDNQYLLGVNVNISFNKDNNYLKRIGIINYYNGRTLIRFHSFPSNSVLILKFSTEQENLNIIERLNNNIEILFNKGDKFVNKYNLSDINRMLYQTDEEEKEWSFHKRESYELNIINDGNIENKIKFVYSGIHQIMDIIKRIKKKEKQNLLFSDDINNNNIKSLINEKRFIESLYYDISQNDNLIEYIIERIDNIESFALLKDFLKNNILPFFKRLPNHFKSIFFESIIISLYHTIIRISLKNIPYSFLNFGDFATALSLSRFQFYGRMNSISNYIRDISIKNPDLNEIISISKGIPFNVLGKQRMYFRDTLISFKALFLMTNNFKEGKNMLKLIASTLRHGLIPDLFDEEEKMRYYSRDTCWYFINSVKEYINYTQDYKFLKEEIDLLFLSDISYENHLEKKMKGEIVKYTIEQIIQIIFQSHAKGIHFIEWNYGIKNNILKNEGYNIDIDLDPNTGFIYGGNYYNSGTWMNKIGASSKGKNKGLPATPRPGANIEIISLLYTCLDFIIELGKNNYFKYKSVKLPNNDNYPYTQWKLLIKDSFEDEFYVKKYNIEINNSYNNDYNSNPIKGNIYKDYINKNDVNIYEFQLRPNFLIALYISPELFTFENVINAMNNVELYLLRNEENVIGLKTLDKTDKEYNGMYNKKETNNFFTSGGFNIHNGIEHTWLYGIYLLLKIKYFFIENKNIKTSEDLKNKVIKFASNKLIPIMNIIKNNKWFGLPEMTDEEGNIIIDGNKSDIKAMAIFSELIEMLSKINSDNENTYEYSNSINDNSNIDN